MSPGVGGFTRSGLGCAAQDLSSFESVTPIWFPHLGNIELFLSKGAFNSNSL